MRIAQKNIIWPKTASEAILMQNALRNKVSIKNKFENIRTIAGIDCSYNIKDNISKAVVVLMDIKELKPFKTIVAYSPTEFPYIPGLLSFREIPVILKALEELKTPPDLLMVDGQGVAHPRGLGIAAHLGVLMDLPAIGVAKSRLVGHYREPNLEKGDAEILSYKNERIGTVVRSKDNVKPLFISPGHRIDHDTAVELVMKCLTKYRLPEPTRIADKISKIKETGNLI